MFHPPIPKKFRPPGFDILYEDRDLIVGNKAPGLLTVAALWEKQKTVHHLLNRYVRKGSLHSKKNTYVVHRLDQATSGVLVFAKSLQAQEFLKDHWKTFTKTYFAIVLGHPRPHKQTLQSYLSEDENYFVSSSKNPLEAKLAITELEVVAETSKHSLLKILLHTGKKNQIRVHLSELGHPLLGDDKYGASAKNRASRLMLHALSLEFQHPHHKKTMRVVAPVPADFQKLIPYSYPE